MTANCCRIQPALQSDQLPDCTVYALRVRGTAFLWHQVCTFHHLLLQASSIPLAAWCKWGWPLVMLIMMHSNLCELQLLSQECDQEHWPRMHDSAPVMRGDRFQ
jgi:hypothetical protein